MENKEKKPDYKALVIDNVEYKTLLTKKYVERKNMKKLMIGSSMRSFQELSLK